MTKRTVVDLMTAAAAEPAEKARKVPPSRRGKQGWLVYIDRGTLQRLRASAALHGRSLQSFGEEAVDVLLERYPLP